MLNTKDLILVLLVCSLAYSQKKQPYPITENGPFSGVFAATWLGGFCYKMGTSDTDTTKCDDIQLAQWDQESFTIHGLWPSGGGQVETPFDVSYIENNPSLHADMRNFMPPQSNSRRTDDPHFLWRHEYEKHGKDYVAILKIKNEELYGDASDEALHVAYYQATINFYKSQGFQKINIDTNKIQPNYFTDSFGNSGVFYNVTKAQLGEMIGVDTSMFHISCDFNTELSHLLQEIKLCYVIDDDLSFRLVTCQSIQHESIHSLTDNCKNFKYFKMLGYDPKVPSQQPVTVWPIPQSTDL